jgi:hypothetical protein
LFATTDARVALPLVSPASSARASSKGIVMKIVVSVLSFALLASTVACGSDDDGGRTTGSSSGTTGSSGGSSTSPTEPAEEKKTSAIGPSCEAYLDCCEELAAEVPQAAGSCDQTRTSIEDAQAKGASTSSYESACKSGLESAQSMGYCE